MRPLAESMLAMRAIAESRPVAALAAAFEAAGHEFALVGGPVRDALLGRSVTDLDFTTSAKPDETRAILEALTKSIWDVGREFGTIAALVHGEHVEITTYRADSYQSDSRKPIVQFGDSIEGDLVRRDFTINALALMLPSMRLIDISGGVEDLLARRMKTPGAAETSFTDDPLRMMRAARFTSQLGFEVVPEVRDAMIEFAERLDIISAERIRDELVKLLSTEDPVPGLRLLVDTGLADRFLPELTELITTQDDHGRHKDVYEHSLTVLQQAIELELVRGRRASAGGVDGSVDAVDAGDAGGAAAAAGAGAAAVADETVADSPGPDVVLRLASLLHDIGKPSTRRFEHGGVTFHHHDVVGAKLAKKRLKALRFDNDTIKRVCRLIELHLRFFGYSDQQWTDSAVRRYVRDAGDVLEQLHILTRADVTTRNRRKAERLEHAYDDIERRIDELAEAEEMAAVRPDLDGEQIMGILGVPPGPIVGEAYKFLLELRLDEGPIGAEAAEARLREWFKEKQDAGS